MPRKNHLERYMDAAQALAARKKAASDATFESMGRLVSIGSEEVRQPSIGYMARMLVLCTLPHRERALGQKIERKNGNLTLHIQPGPDGKVPFGIYPRLIMAWLTQEVQRTKSPTISLGSNFTTFMHRIGVETASYGKRGVAGQVREQLRRLLGSRIWVELDNSNPGWNVRTLAVAEEWDLWFDPKSPEQGILLDSSITLGKKLFEDMLEHPIPFDWRVVEELRDSPLAVDLYIWLGMRLSYVERSPAVLSWAQLSEQLGADYGDLKDFTKQAKKQLRRISWAWPELHYETPRGRLYLYPSATHVPKKLAEKV
jgi:Plasmid encoded RepA protein